ncbi:MAG: hypothetical protein HDR08_01660 [Lachnospiraceae bacterium]|nr:hypothetical protein [Lachnospiraceae bacterium]
MTESEFVKEKQKILKSMPDTICLTRAEAKSILEELEQYRAIGTVEECRKATEKQREKKYNQCPVCDRLLRSINDNFCGNCGQAMNMEDLREG